MVMLVMDVPTSTSAQIQILLSEPLFSSSLRSIALALQFHFDFPSHVVISHDLHRTNTRAVIMWLIIYLREKAPNCGIKGKAASHVTALARLSSGSPTLQYRKLLPYLLAVYSKPRRILV